MTAQPDLEMMRNEIFRIGAKMDAMPQVYIPRLEHDVWRSTLEKRVDKHDDRLGSLETAISGIELRLSTKIEETFTKLVEKAADAQNNLQQSWFSMHQGTLMWIVMLIIGIMQFVLYYLRR